MNNFKKILRRAVLGITALLLLLTSFIYLAPLAMAIPAERDNFIILGREGQDSEGKSILIEEKIILRSAPNVNSSEQGRLDSGTSVRVLDIIQLEAETFYLVMKVGEGGGLSGWVSEDYIYEITVAPEGE